MLTGLILLTTLARQGLILLTTQKNVLFACPPRCRFRDRHRYRRDATDGNAIATDNINGQPLQLQHQHEQSTEPQTPTFPVTRSQEYSEYF